VRKFLEMFRQRQPLALIGGTDVTAIELIRSGDQALVDEALSAVPNPGSKKPAKWTRNSPTNGS
jgi:hypothetical protein